MFSQLLGLIALTIIVCSYQQKDKNKFLLIQLVANFFYFLQYIVLSAYSGASSTFIAVLRNFVFYKYEKDEKEIPVGMLFFFEAILVIMGICTYNGLISIIPTFIVAIYSYGTWQKDLGITYFICFITTILWLIYNFSVGAYVAGFGSIIEFFGCLFGLIKYIKTNGFNLLRSFSLVSKEKTNI